MNIKDMKLYNIGEVIQNMKFGQVAILIEGYGSNEDPYSNVGTTIYFDKDDYGALKYLDNDADVVIAKVEDDMSEEKWIIVDREMSLMNPIFIPDDNLKFAIFGTNQSSTLTFTSRDGNEVFSIKDDGIHYKGKLIEIDKDIENAFREFLQSQGNPVSFSVSGKD